jgi:hypothetical protein
LTLFPPPLLFSGSGGFVFPFLAVPQTLRMLPVLAGQKPQKDRLLSDVPPSHRV